MIVQCPVIIPNPLSYDRRKQVLASIIHHMLDNPFQLKLKHEAKLRQPICINNHQTQQVQDYNYYLTHISQHHVCGILTQLTKLVSSLHKCFMIRFGSSFFQRKQENVPIKPNTMNLFLTKIPQSFQRSFVLLICLFLRWNVYLLLYLFSVHLLFEDFCSGLSIGAFESGYRREVFSGVV